MGWRAKDDYYYGASLLDSTTIRFVKARKPDINDISQDLQEALVNVPDSMLLFLDFLGVDDYMNIYLSVVGNDLAQASVLIYDTMFQLVAKLTLPPSPNRYQWYMTPFMRPSDGNIYEFRCLDDGLHVIRWTRK